MQLHVLDLAFLWSNGHRIEEGCAQTLMTHDDVFQKLCSVAGLAVKFFRMRTRQPTIGTYACNMTGDAFTTWDSATESFISVVEGIDDWNVQSPCPGWTIADLVAHTSDLESMLAADPRPNHSPAWESIAHIDSDFGRLTEVGVDYRRGWSRGDLLDDLTASHERARERVASLGPEATIPWLRGETPIPRLLSMRTFDVWMHEQDARVATGNLGNLDGPGAREAMTYLSAGLPKVWGKSVGAPAGSVLNVVTTEPGLAAEFWVRVGEDGKAGLVDEIDADVSATMPWMSFVMLASGRATERDFAEDVVVVGDQSLGVALLDSMAVTP